MITVAINNWPFIDYQLGDWKQIRQICFSCFLSLLVSAILVSGYFCCLKVLFVVRFFCLPSVDMRLRYILNCLS